MTVPKSLNKESGATLRFFWFNNDGIVNYPSFQPGVGLQRRLNDGFLGIINKKGGQKLEKTIQIH